MFEVGRDLAIFRECYFVWLTCVWTVFNMVQSSCGGFAVFRFADLCLGLVCLWVFGLCRGGEDCGFRYNADLLFGCCGVAVLVLWFRLSV